MRRLLVIDFDFFFPMLPRSPAETWELYDWGHQEASFFINYIWSIRASSFMRSKLPLPGLDSSIHDFWKRFRIRPSADLFYADSNVYAAASVLRDQPFRHVTLYDAHHDSGYRQTYRQYLKHGNVTCEDWMYVYHQRGASLEVVYPAWRANERAEHDRAPLIHVETSIDRGQRDPRWYDDIYVCRSGAWVPPWVEEQFWQLIDLAPVTARTAIGPCERRAWGEGEIAEARSQADQMQQLIDQHVGLVSNLVDNVPAKP